MQGRGKLGTIVVTVLLSLFPAGEQNSRYVGFPLSRPALAPQKAIRNYLPDLTTLDAQSTYHGARPGPTLAPWCTGGSPFVPYSRERENRPAAGGETSIEKTSFDAK